MDKQLVIAKVQLMNQRARLLSKETVTFKKRPVRLRRSLECVTTKRYFRCKKADCDSGVDEQLSRNTKSEVQSSLLYDDVATMYIPVDRERAIMKLAHRAARKYIRGIEQVNTAFRGHSQLRDKNVIHKETSSDSYVGIDQPASKLTGSERRHQLCDYAALDMQTSGKYDNSIEEVKLRTARKLAGRI